MCQIWDLKEYNHIHSLYCIQYIIVVSIAVAAAVVFLDVFFYPVIPLFYSQKPELTEQSHWHSNSVLYSVPSLPLLFPPGCRKLYSKSSQVGPKSGESSWIWRDSWRRTSCASTTARRTTCMSNTSVPKTRLRRYWCWHRWPKSPTFLQKISCWVITYLPCSL